MVGDIIDVALLKKIYGEFWDDRYAYNEFNHIADFSEDSKTRIIYVQGNHECGMFEKHAGKTFGRMTVEKSCIYKLANKKKLFVEHGHAFDPMLKSRFKYFSKLGTLAYIVTMSIESLLWKLRIKNNFTNFVKHIAGVDKMVAQFRSLVVAGAKTKNVDGVVCGHIHTPEIMDVDGFTYINPGDCMENKTVIEEDFEGNLKIVKLDAIL